MGSLHCSAIRSHLKHIAPRVFSDSKPTPVSGSVYWCGPELPECHYILPKSYTILLFCGQSCTWQRAYPVSRVRGSSRLARFAAAYAEDPAKAEQGIEFGLSVRIDPNYADQSGTPRDGARLHHVFSWCELRSRGSQRSSALRSSGVLAIAPANTNLERS